MPVNWDELDSEIDSIIESSAAATDDNLASRMSSLTRMTEQEVKELFPEPADVKKLSELLRIVKSSDDRNTKINGIVTRAEDFGGIVLSLLQKFT